MKSGHLWRRTWLCAGRMLRSEIWFAGSVQWSEIRGAYRSPVADGPTRFAAVDGHLSAGATVDSSPVLRGHDGGFAYAAAGVRRTQGATHRDGGGQPYTAIDAGVGARAGYDGAKRRKGSKVHAAVDTLGHLLALHVTAASERDREQVGKLAEAVQQLTGEHVELAYVDQGYTGEAAQQAAAAHGIQLAVVKHTQAKRGFVLLPRRWVVERSFAWAERFRRLARDYERMAQTLAGWHYVAFVCLMLAQLFSLLNRS
jgi:transposase